MAALGAGLIIAAALIWSIFGRLPVNVSANGMFMDDDGIYTVMSETEGTVEEDLEKKRSNVEAHANEGIDVFSLMIELEKHYEKKIFK